MIYINPDWIMWDADTHSKYQAKDLVWTLEPEYPIEKLGGKGFIEQMKIYLDEEIHGMLESMALPKDASSELAASAGEGRLAGWIDLDSQLSRGEAIQEELHIAEIPCEEEPNRNCLCDGWHRIAAAIKHGRSTIPAYVGRFNKAGGYEMNTHIDDTTYLQWEDGMYVMLDDLEDDYEKAIVEDSLRDSVYFEDTHDFGLIDSEDCIGAHLSCAGTWWAKDLETKLTRAQALYIATGETTCTK